MAHIPGIGPLHIDSVSAPTGGEIGMTHCPGRSSVDAAGLRMQRNLNTDVSAIEAWGATVVVTLLESTEFATYGVPALAAAMRHRSFTWHHVPIPDMAAPDARSLSAWAKAEPDVLAALARGSRVLFHCAAGYGRTGTVTAKLLVDMGMAPEEAIALVRRRPGAIETPAQEAFVADRRRFMRGSTASD